MAQFIHCEWKVETASTSLGLPPPFFLSVWPPHPLPSTSLSWMESRGHCAVLEAVLCDSMSCLYF